MFLVMRIPSPARRGLRWARGRSSTEWSLAALGSGLLLGGVLHSSSFPWTRTLIDVIRPVGKLWMAALQIVIIPLVITQVLAAIVRARSNRSIGVVGAKAVLLFVIMLLTAGLFTLAVAGALVSLYPLDVPTSALLGGGRSISQESIDPSHLKSASIGRRIGDLVPVDILQFLSRKAILPALIFAILLGLGLERLSPERRVPLERAFQALAETTMKLIRWILKVAPLGVFTLCLDLAVRTGVRAVGLLGSYVIIVCGMLVLSTALLYPLTAILAGISIRRFAQAVAPAQIVAVSTRSSLSSLPALVEGAREHLRLPASDTAFVLPLAVSVFKLDRTISCTAELLLLAKVFQVRIGPGEFAIFLATIILLSFSTPGIPDNGAISSTLPAYLAVGIPMEGPIILRTVVAIPDVFETAINVTGDMSAAAILSRSPRAEREA